MPPPWRSEIKQADLQSDMTPYLSNHFKRPVDLDVEAAKQPEKRVKIKTVQNATATTASSVPANKPESSTALSEIYWKDGDGNMPLVPDDVVPTLPDLVAPESVRSSPRPQADLSVLPSETCIGTRVRTRASKRPALSGFSRRDVERSLPGGDVKGGPMSILDHGFWSVRHEKILRMGWSDADEEALVTGLCDAEVETWSMMQDLYSAEPPDLFRYGLRIGEDTAAFWKTLLALLPHPFWEQQDVECQEEKMRGHRSMNLLRYVLQLTVQTRLRSRHGIRHVKPKGPPYLRSEETNFLAWLRESRQDDPATMAAMHEWWFRVYVQALYRIQHTYRRYLHYELQHWYPHQVLQIPVVEHVEFRLTVDDLKLVHIVLDTMYTHSRTYEKLRYERQALAADVTATSFLVEYQHARDRDRLFMHRDRNAVVRAKRLAVVAKRREATIRLLMSQDGGKHRLPDIPPHDRDHHFHLWPASSSEVGNLAIERVPPSPRTRKWLLENPTRRTLAPDTDGQVRDMFWRNYGIISGKLADDTRACRPGEGDGSDWVEKMDKVPIYGLLFGRAGCLAGEDRGGDGDDDGDDDRDGGQPQLHDPIAGLLYSPALPGNTSRHASRHSQTHIWI